MKNKTIIVISAFITVFLLTIGIGVITNVTAKNKVVAAAPVMDVAAFIEREAAYQQKINEANQQIALANQQIQTLLTTATQIPVEPEVSEYLFTAKQAGVLAQLVAKAAPVDLPAIVLYGDVPAYEVVYPNGKVYVDANTGEILSNTIKKQVTYITTEQAIRIAKSYLGSDQMTKIEFGTFNGNKTYVVSFSNGQRVYVSLLGKVVAVQMAQANPTSVPQPTEPQPTEPPHVDEEEDD
jgi:uncharacterized membrane protein YkoI